MTTHADRVAELADRSIADAIAAILDPGVLDQQRSQAPPESPDDSDEVVRWWLARMTAPDTGLVDRMAWFWHGHLTTSADKVDAPVLVAQQLDVLRREGLGNLRTLMHSVVTGGAMLQYLDASWSEASRPNENLARELMELFTIGRGNYSEDDVRAAARALAGWVVEKDEDENVSVTWHRDRAFIAPLVFLGEQADWDTDRVIARLCDDPAAHARIAGRLWSFLVRRPLTDDGAAELGRWWNDHDLEILPLVERILSDPAFAQSAGFGTRSPVEWWCNAVSTVGLTETDSWAIHQLGQYPYAPPNVAGWPPDRWLTPGSLLGRARFGYTFEPAELDLPSDTDAILDRCSLFVVDHSTVDAIEAVAATPDIDDYGIIGARWRLALCAPEYQLS